MENYILQHASLILMALGLEIMLWFFINAFNMVLFTFSYFMDENYY